MFTLRNLTAATLAATLAAAPATFVVAQDAPTAPQTTQAQEDSQSRSFADAQIDAFANTAVEIRKIQEDYSQRMEGVEDQGDQQELLKQADAEMRAAIEQSDDITVEDYLAINRAAATDEDLNQRIAQRIQKMQIENAG
ncbi:DUF4168 domain-containing protein [Roseovarius sp. S1116L3]